MRPRPPHFYSHNGIEIFHGDCREILPGLEKYFDLTLTDPPYGVNLKYNSYNDTPRNLERLIEEALPIIRLYSKVLLLTPGTSNLYKYPEPTWVLCWTIPAGSGLCRWGYSGWQPVLAYGKDPYLANGLGPRIDTIIDNSPASIQNRPTDKITHPAPKPYSLWRWLLMRGCSKKDAIILDPFMGSGTTLLAAKDVGFRAVGIDIDKSYCELAVSRLSQETVWRTESEEKET